MIACLGGMPVSEDRDSLSLQVAFLDLKIDRIGRLLL